MFWFVCGFAVALMLLGATLMKCGSSDEAQGIGLLAAVAGLVILAVNCISDTQYLQGYSDGARDRDIRLESIRTQQNSLTNYNLDKVK